MDARTIDQLCAVQPGDSLEDQAAKAVVQTLLLAALAGREVNEDFTVGGQRVSCYIADEDAYFWGPPLGGTVAFIKEWPGVWRLDHGGSRQFGW